MEGEWSCYGGGQFNRRENGHVTGGGWSVLFNDTWWDIRCHVSYFYKQVQISRSYIRPHIKWAVSLVIVHMITSILLRGFVWVYMG